MMQTMAHKNKSNWSPLKKTSLKNNKMGRHKKPSQILSLKEAEDRLFDIFFNHSMDSIKKKEISLLCRYYLLLMEAQTHSNFTRLLSFREIAIKHFIDSAIVPKLTPLQFPLLDIGTGPGLPGIVLKILFPNEKILLAEGVQKRVEFLKKIRDELELNQLEIFGKNISSDFEYPVNGVITRAVEDMRNTLTNVSNCIQPHGQVYFMKGPQVDPEMLLITNDLKSQFHLKNDIAYSLPKTPHKRRLIIFERKNP